mgnify:FL=1
MECEHKECRLEKIVLEVKLSTTKMVLNQVLGKLHRLQEEKERSMTDWNADQVKVIQEGIDDGIKFATSARGQYIIAQALYIASKALGEVQPPVMQEKSNIADMKYLMELLYSSFIPVFELQYTIRNNVQENKVKESLENNLTESNILNVLHYLNKK